jgi:hypothetical protein
VATTSTVSAAPARRSAGPLAAVFLVGAIIAVGLGVYGRLHDPTFRPLFTLGFSGMLQMKAWLSTLVAVLVIVQLLSALWMWGRLPGAGAAPGWITLLHRWSGTAAFVVSLPVAFHCLWALGFESADARVLVHSIAGCLFYGAFAAKMLGLRLKTLPGWALPVLGGVLFTLLIVLWLTSALWLFTRPGVPAF